MGLGARKLSLQSIFTVKVGTLYNTKPLHVLLVVVWFVVLLFPSRDGHLIYLKIITGDPLIYTMGHPKCNVSSQKKEELRVFSSLT